MKRTAIALTLISTLMLLAAGALLANPSSANFFPDPGPDLPRIYIRNDGSVEPVTVPIERTGNLYKLMGNIVLYTIEIQCNNVILDGAGYTIQGNESRIKGYDDGNNGIILVGRNNVVITRLNFEKGDTGIRISGASNITVINNSFSNGICTGIEVQDSIFTLIEANNFTDLHTDLNVPAVMLNGSKNTFRNNTLTGSTYGITIEGSSNEVSDNKIASVLPIILNNADSNTIANNNITGPMPSPLLPNQTCTGNEGIALFVSCSNNAIIGNTITGFANQAIRITFGGSNNTIYGNYFANNQFAIAVEGWGDFVPMNNIFYGNTFAADSCNIQISDRDCNFWDNGTIGNYWRDYNGTDSDGDGIGDSAYIINGFKWDTDAEGFVSFVSSQDNYPLMTPFEVPSALMPSPEPQLESEPFPTAFVVGASGVSATVIGIGLLAYLKKRRNTKH